MISTDIDVVLPPPPDYSHISILNSFEKIKDAVIEFIEHEALQITTLSISQKLGIDMNIKLLKISYLIQIMFYLDLNAQSRYQKMISQLGFALYLFVMKNNLLPYMIDEHWDIRVKL